MRPKKRILLAADNEDRLGVLRFLLETNGRAVTGVATAPEALEAIAAHGFDLVVIDWPLDGLGRLVEEAHARWTASLVLAARERERPDCCADAVLLRGTPAPELLGRIKVMCARKRGPRKKMPLAAAPAIEMAAEAVNF